MAVWDEYLTERDRAVYATAGYGARRPLGSRPAIVVIDVNYDFVGHERAPVLESAKTWRNSCGEEGWDGVAAIATLLEAARDHSLPIFYSTSEEPRPDGLGRGMWRSSRVGETAGVPGFVGSDVVAEIAPQERDVLLRKSKPSAFFGTGLLALLLELGVEDLLVVGTTTSGCVRATVVDAFSHNFNVVVVEEGCFDRGQASHALNLFDMDAKYADVLPLQEVLEHLAGLPTEVFPGRVAPAVATPAAPEPAGAVR
ncbi:isochorismatase family protein [Pseudokineococcus lusitanus]|uniref:Nicotinamidase-related amidase n=1 Tax=Pseudokineococcus lusitanus TaxID=763993 RepID=A0A3N1G9W7_9ACTN|nr:isochorismatase family protein [Pseudokineococcus lusitanus]ROP27001.1 nicotinamidase-related amidase [Pseudokineococcus lusitanus]